MLEHFRPTGNPYRRGVSYAFFALAVLSICVQSQVGGSPEENPEKGIDPGLFKRDQPTLRRVMEWDGKIIVDTDRLFALDVERASVKPLEILGAKKVLNIASGGPGKEFALCETKGEARLLVKEKEKWVEQELPEEARKSAKRLRLLADPDAVVLLSEEKAYQLAAGKWTTILLKPRPKDIWIEHEARHALLVCDKIYLGYDAGEWGGGLLCLDLSKGTWDEIDLKNAHLPIRDLKSGSDGKIWAVGGLAHLTLLEGTVHSYDGKVWKTVCTSSQKDTVNWELPSASLDALAFDAKANLWLLSGSLGLVRQEKEKWVRVTPGWPDHQYVRSLHITPGGVAVVGTLDAGILLFEIKSGRMRRVVLRE